MCSVHVSHPLRSLCVSLLELSLPVSLVTNIVFKYTINCTQPVSDKIFDLSAFEKFLHDKIKVEGRVGNLGDSITISQVGDGKIEVVTHIPFSGRYLKYL